MYLNRIFAFLCLAVLLAGCDSLTNREPDLSGIRADVEVESLEGALFACRSLEEVKSFLNRHSYLQKVYFEGYAQDTSLASRLYEQIRNNELQRFKNQVDSLFGKPQDTLEEPLEEAFRHLKYYYPDFQPPRVETIVTGFLGNDLYVSDSLIIIGLEYFGGPKATYRPQVYTYQLSRYQKEYLVPSILFFMSDRYVRTDPQDRTLLADMIGYGKAFEFVKHCVPQTPDSLILGFSERDLVRTYNSQTQIWAFVVENKLLYEKAEQIKQKYVGERPFTPEIGEDVPGGIGRWLGWRIVSMYLANNPEVTLQELMKNPDARQILQQSGYKGQIDE
ncbi:gliding motility lipoprotein GldB [Persicitalea jodogahamensis]|uniref:Gliding motility lipoprotein GldB n=2 Tax=Persicitalea jodogahamensis TaxID=402147 RepID=A0A8J3D8K2_9BACT|nr:gliding motility lipoprotein GldB [Persicitalea jodogahamensis]